MTRVIEYKIVHICNANEYTNLSNAQLLEYHTNPAIVMTLLNTDQHLQRYVRIYIDGRLAGYKSFMKDHRVTMDDLV